MGNKTIHRLIVGFFGNNLPEATRKAFEKWFINESYLQEKEDTLLEIWEQVPAEASEQTKTELNKLHRRIDKAPRLVERRSQFQQILRIAAILLLPLISGVGTYWILQSEPKVIDPEWTECFVPDGDKKKVTLSDGSRVWLNSGSLLISSWHFEGDKRLIYLNGEASFDVAKDSLKPFIVKTAHLEIEALGTLFNVEAYPDSKLAVVTLEEGKVRVSSDLAADQPIILYPNEQIIYNSESATISKEKVDASRVLRWKEGYLTFRGASFDYIIKTIERHFNVTINYETERFAGRSFTMKFRPDENLYQVLEIMKEMINGLNYKIKGDIIYIN